VANGFKPDAVGRALCIALCVAITLVGVLAHRVAASPLHQRQDQLAAYLERVPTSAADRETALERQKRRRRIARAVVEVSRETRPAWLTERVAVAATMTIWHAESRFSQTVHAGGLSRWGSDDGKSRCMGQVKVSAHLPKSEWEKTAGTDLEATKRCARATLRRFRGAAWACGRFTQSAASWRLAFRNYGTGGCDEPLPSEAKRAARAIRWMAAL